MNGYVLNLGFHNRITSCEMHRNSNLNLCNRLPTTLTSCHSLALAVSLGENREKRHDGKSMESPRSHTTQRISRGCSTWQQVEGILENSRYENNDNSLSIIFNTNEPISVELTNVVQRSNQTEINISLDYHDGKDFWCHSRKYNPKRRQTGCLWVF